MFKHYAYALLIGCIGLISCSSSGDEPITTDGSNVTITATPESLSAGPTAQTVELTVNSTSDWSITSDQDWCTVYPTGGVKNTPTTVSVKVTALSGQDSRAAVLTVRSSNARKEVVLTQKPAASVELSSTSLTAGGQAQTVYFDVVSNTEWTLSGATNWCKPTVTSGAAGTTQVGLELTANTSNDDREATISVAYDGGSKEFKLTQMSDAIVAPEGYTLVWNDEFNDSKLSMPDESKWKYEVWGPGYVNDELQRYVAGKLGSDVTAEVKDGFLHINAIKAGNEVISARLNTKTSWKYGYFEARLKLPKGRGTWPAFWMMPQAGGSWPSCGEIDIMEEVGYRPNYTSSTIHCKAYNHTNSTQKTAERYTAGAEDEYHVYALEWTENSIKTYVDGVNVFTFVNDNAGNTDTWPFNKEFYIILNLAWGGSWGGAMGVDESALPTSLDVDYVRVFKKN